MPTDKNNRPLFKDLAHETHFRTHGYVKIPFFKPEEVAQLTAACEALDGSFNTQFTTTVWSNDATYRQAVYTTLQSIYAPHIDRLMLNCKTAMATILTKHPGLESAIDIHQDWSFTDETQFSAVNIWVPLIDTTEANGALHVLPFSHRFDVPYRGRHITPQFANVKHLVWPLGHAITAKAGEAIIFDVKMVHYSNPNRTTEKRIATAMVALPQEADILHYINYRPSQNQITKMIVDESFYNRYAHDDEIPRTSNYSELILERTQLSTDLFKNEYEQICLKAQEL